MAAELTPEVRAAGGVVWRVDGGGSLQVLVVHRPGYEDWTFPKGKVDPDDLDDEHTALREVEEETGLRCSLGRELPGTDYFDRKGRSKHVRYWEMRVLSGEFAPNREVDEARWLDLGAARPQLTYEHDRDVLDTFGSFAVDGRPSSS
ncbi:MAG TPA: NUDIX hydrolase [Acidimicrobiales bacterium]|nr:NUDIX hydrolase [Acidimicrobiales bacterium]